MTHVDLIEKLLRYGCSLAGGFLTTDLVWGIDTIHRNGTGPNRRQNESRRSGRIICVTAGGTFFKTFPPLEFPSITQRTPLRIGRGLQVPAI